MTLKPMMCVTIDTLNLAELKIGHIYYMDLDTKFKATMNNTEYAMFYSDATGKHMIGNLITSHFTDKNIHRKAIIDDVIYITNTLINLKFEDNYPKYAESIYNKLAEIVEIVG